MRVLSGFVLFVLLLVPGIGAAIWSGLYPVGADDPHWRTTHWLLASARERSVARAAAAIVPPALDAPALLLEGGADYADMCAACHLQPGRSETDLSLGLYPAPPNLASPDRSGRSPEALARERFWVIKHGLKASGMPAWGKTHDDRRIWAMVAFIARLPELSPAQYQVLTARGKPGAHH